MIIREAAVKDIPAIQHLTGLIWPPTYHPIIGEAQVRYMIGLFYNADALERQMTREGHTFLVGSESGEDIAFASFSAQGPGVYKLHKLYVLPGRQRSGAGNLLLQNIIGNIRAKGATQLILNVNRHNKNAIAFYQRTGFLHLKDVDLDIGNGYFMNDHVLGLPL